MAVEREIRLDAPAQTIPRYEGDGAVRRLSFPQERLFLLDRIMPGLGAYNVPTLVRVRATLNEAALRGAFELVVARHEILRTRLDLVDGAPVQEAFEPAPFDLTVADLRSLPRAEAQARADELLGELVGPPSCTLRPTRISCSSSSTTWARTTSLPDCCSPRSTRCTAR